MPAGRPDRADDDELLLADDARCVRGDRRIVTVSTGREAIRPSQSTV